MTRLRYIDWLRGVAVLIMILWHSIDAWTVQDGRSGPVFAAILFTAGWAAPLFLLLAGVSVSLAANARITRGLSRQEAGWALQKRGWQIFLLAHLFRFQSFLLNPNASWNALLKPDILNVLGLGIVASAFLWTRARSTRAAVSALLVPAAVVVALLTPLSREWWWPTLLHPRLEAYIRPVGGFGVFSLFPSIGYVLVGAFIGTRIAEAGAGAARFQGRLALWGACVAALGLGLLMIPALNLPTPSSSPAAFMCRTGAMMLGLAAAWVVVRRRPTVRWSPLVVLGQTSLFVYWVHVELAYGVFSFPVRHRLDLPASLVAYACLTLLMVGAASLWQRRPTGPLIPLHMRLPPSRQTEG